MSAKNLVCEGIGFRMEDLFCYLDPEKLRKYMVSELELYLELSDNSYWSYTYYYSRKDAQLQFLDSVKVPDGIAGVIATADKSGSLISVTNGDGVRYLLYSPGYSLRKSGKQFRSMKALRKHLVKSIIRFAIEGVLPSELNAAIVGICEPAKSDRYGDELSDHSKKNPYLIINNHHDYGHNQYYFKAINNVGITEEAFLSAVREYYDSSIGQGTPRKIGRNFGWGNVIEGIPAAIWAKHGLLPVTGDEYCLLEYDDIQGESIIFEEDE